jgi:hypothetical protein
MKKLAILLAIALELAVGGCGNNTPTSTITTTANTSAWEAQLTGGTGQASLLNFVVTFSVNTTGPLDVTGFAFFNQGACFATTANSQTVSGTTTLTTSNNLTVTGPFSLTIKSNSNSNSLALTGTVTGTSNGTTTTIGTLSNGVVTGTWTLNSSDSNCTGGGSSPPSGTFIMCQGAATCSVTPAAAEPAEKL